MYNKLNRLVCVIHGIEYEYPAEHRELSISPPKCPVCALEEWEKTKKELAKTKSDLQRVLDAITIKLNSEVKP